MPLTAPLWHATRLGRRLIMGALLLPVLASSQTVGDKALLDMRAAYSRGQSAELARLLPTVRGHVLEPLARYWDMRVRLDTASPTEIRAALDAMAGTYWEDRLRNDWLLQLGKRRDWPTLAAQHRSYRMKDDKEVSCYALAADAILSKLEVSAEAKRLW